MLEVFTNFVCSTIMAILGLQIINKITESKIKYLNFKNLILIFILILIPVLLYGVKYTSIYTLTIYLLSIIIYKKIFNQNIIQSIISTSEMMIITFAADIITMIIFMTFTNLYNLRVILYIKILANILLSLICLIALSIKQIQGLTNKIYLKLSNKKNMSSILFIILFVIVLTVLSYNFAIKFGYNIEYLINIIIVIIFGILFYIYLIEKSTNDKLTTEYDNMFNYVQNFEDWIEKEQLNRHEYKNQLAVLRCMTKDKKVISKIDEILEDSINVEGEVVNQLKSLPKGGLKGLMYYKSAIAQKKKVNLVVDISIETHSILSKLSEQDMRILCKLIGIYFDNAIEAANETRKKNVTIEIYEIKDKVSIIISNTFKEHKNLDKRNEKGVSSKGEGHGNGLYFASKLISKNDWLFQKQDIIDKYYIQELSIKKPVAK